MVSLQTYLNSLNFTSELASVKNILDKARVETTFWGNRVVKVEGFTGSLSLDDIASKILKINVDKLFPAERMVGVEMVRKLKNFYQVTDFQINHVNLFTWLLSKMWDFPCTCSIHSTRFYIEVETERRFLSYRKVKFINLFGDCDKLSDHPAFQGAFSTLPDDDAPVSDTELRGDFRWLRIVAKEDAVRALGETADKLI